MKTILLTATNPMLAENWRDVSCLRLDHKHIGEKDLSAAERTVYV